MFYNFQVSLCIWHTFISHHNIYIFVTLDKLSPDIVKLFLWSISAKKKIILYTRTLSLFHHAFLRPNCPLGSKHTRGMAQIYYYFKKSSSQIFFKRFISYTTVSSIVSSSTGCLRWIGGHCKCFCPVCFCFWFQAFFSIYGGKPIESIPMMQQVLSLWNVPNPIWTPCSNLYVLFWD